jgi:hypothetical protein
MQKSNRFQYIHHELVQVAVRSKATTRRLRLWVRTAAGYGCLSLLSGVCRQVEVSATGLSLVQMSPTYCGALCVI